MRNFKTFFQEAMLGLEYHSHLNPVLWTDQEVLYPEVRGRLMAFAQAFQAFGHVPDAALKDILMVGGNCGYNYTKFSDIDVHLVIDKGALGAGLIVDEYLRSLKLLWSAKHNIRVRGYNIEPYFQGADETVESQGIYSIKNNNWLKKPTHQTGINFDDDAELHKKVEHYQSLIDHMIGQKSSTAAIEELKVKLSAMRKDGLAAGGEYSQGNLIFKSLRNTGHLDKMTHYLIQTMDHSLSL